MKEIRVKVCQGPEGDWFWIPEDMYEEFQAKTDMIESDDSDIDLVLEFDQKFRQYATGGDSDIMPIDFKLDGVEVIKV